MPLTPYLDAPKLILLLSENYAITSPRDLRALVRMAVEAEEAGFDGVQISEHILLGPGADSDGRLVNQRDYVMPGNQDPATPWPSSIVLLSAIAGATTRLRLLAGAVIAPLRHPVLLAKELATLDLISEGRLIVLPTVSWHQPEYEQLGVPWAVRGELLDEHLEAWRLLWQPSPASFEGRHYRFENIYLEPKPFRPEGPTLWFGGSSMHPRLVRRIVAHGQGFAPMFSPTPEDFERLASAMIAAGRDISELEIAAWIAGRFRDDHSLADLDRALNVVPTLAKRGYSTIAIKPAQFVENPRDVGSLCRKFAAAASSLASDGDR